MAGFFDSFKDPFKKLKNIRVQSGFAKGELQGFMRQAGSLASAQSRVDTAAGDFGPKFQSLLVGKESLAKADALNTEGDFFTRKFRTGENLLTKEFTQDQVKGFIKAFSKRQEEVFGRRAQPGIAQTRLT